jgi:hypothetical protein
MEEELWVRLPAGAFQLPIPQIGDGSKDPRCSHYADLNRPRGQY